MIRSQVSNGPMWPFTSEADFNQHGCGCGQACKTVLNLYGSGACRNSVRAGMERETGSVTRRSQALSLHYR